MNQKTRKQIGIWLLLGVAMLYVQVLLGGMTRLTGSGLSITEWDVIMGAVPPLNHDQWQKAFDQYKQFPQYQIMNSDMTLSGFKNIFWWEFIHRLWGRLIGVAFVIPFAIFLWKKNISWQLGKRLIIAFLLGALQGLLGWIMVATGLKDIPWVNPVALSLHLILALILTVYLFWTALLVLNPKTETGNIFSLRKFSSAIILLLFLQIFYGGLMAGNHAALFYPTFPKFNDRWLPEGLFSLSPFPLNFINNLAMIQLIHRSLGLILGIVIIVFYFRGKKFSASALLKNSLVALPVLVMIQILLGIITLMNSLGKIPVVYAELHQMTGLVLLTVSFLVNFQLASGRTGQTDAR